MPIQYQTPLTPSPAVTTVDGPVTFSVDILVTSGDVQLLDVDYIITDPASAVFFASGGKIERRQEPVSATGQMTLVNSTQLRCGPGVQDSLGAQIVLSISSNGVLQAPPIGCGVGISSYTCAPAVAAVMGGPVLSHAFAPIAITAAPAATGSTGGSGGKRGSRSGSTRKGKGAGTANSGGKK